MKELSRTQRIFDFHLFYKAEMDRILRPIHTGLTFVLNWVNQLPFKYVVVRPLNSGWIPIRFRFSSTQKLLFKVIEISEPVLTGISPLWSQSFTHEAKIILFNICFIKREVVVIITFPNLIFMTICFSKHFLWTVSENYFVLINRKLLWKCSSLLSLPLKFLKCVRSSAFIVWSCMFCQRFLNDLLSGNPV